jgi:hypothetical protein
VTDLSSWFEIQRNGEKKGGAGDPSKVSAWHPQGAANRQCMRTTDEGYMLRELEYGQARRRPDGSCDRV